MQVIRLTELFQYVTPPCVIISPDQFMQFYFDTFFELNGTALPPYAMVEPNVPYILFSPPDSAGHKRWRIAISPNSIDTYKLLVLHTWGSLDASNPT
jgi:hypothetical protein